MIALLILYVEDPCVWAPGGQVSGVVLQYHGQRMADTRTPIFWPVTQPKGFLISFFNRVVYI